MASYTYSIGAPVVPPEGGGGVVANISHSRRIPCDGGYRLDLTGTFPLGVPLNVHIGPNGTAEDAKCVSGKAGQGTDIYAVDANHLYCFTPRLPIGGPYPILVRAVGTGADSLVPDAIYTIRQDYKTSMFALRSVFPRHLMVGYRKIEDLPPIPDPSP